MAVNKERQLFIKPDSRWRLILAASVVLATGLISFYTLSPNKLRSPLPVRDGKSTKVAPVRVAVTALGRLQPEGEITTLSAPSSTNGIRVDRLLVKEGE